VHLHDKKVTATSRIDDNVVLTSSWKGDMDRDQLRVSSAGHCPDSLYVGRTFRPTHGPWRR